MISNKYIKNPNKNSNKNVDKRFLAYYNISLLLKNETIFHNKKRDQLSSLEKCMKQKNTRGAISLVVELHCSGYFLLIFRKLQSYYLNNINVLQPKGILYLAKFVKYYKSLPIETEKQFPLRIINDMVIRNFLLLFTTLICGSNERQLLKLIKIRDGDFNLNNKKNIIIATDLNAVKPYLKPYDPKEIIIPMNEIITILNNKDIPDGLQKIIFWLSWLFEYEKKYHNGSLDVVKRQIIGLDEKYYKDFIWIIWDMLRDIVPQYLIRYIDSLEKLYIYNFTKGSRRKKSNLLIFAISLYINPLPCVNMPPERINSDLFKRMQKESLYANQRYLQVFKHKEIIERI